MPRAPARSAFLLLSAAATVGWLACARSAPDDSSAVLTEVRQIRALAPAAAREGRRLRLTGVVTYSARKVVVQDETGAVSVDLGGSSGPGLGRLVRLEGITAMGSLAPVVARPRWTEVGDGPLPEARPLRLEELEAGEGQHELSEIRGVVRSAVVQHDGDLRLELQVAGGHLTTLLADYAGVEFASLVGAAVRARGVPSVARDVRGRVLHYVMLVSDPTSLDVERPALGAPPEEELRRSREPLTEAAQVRGLSREVADLGYPVHLSAVVTYVDSDWSVLFVQDETGGVYVDANGEPRLTVRSGDRIELEGRTDGGDFAPQIVSPRIAVVGEGPLPTALRPPLERLSSGAFDSQWLAAEGVVESFREEDEHLWLALVAGRYRFEVETAESVAPERLEALVEARVRVVGACGARFNEKGQALGFQIYTPDLSYVTVLEPAPDPFSRPPRPIGRLLQFAPGDGTVHRVRVRGVVTLARPGEVFLKDETAGILVRPARYAETSGLAPGTLVDVVGFPTTGDYTPFLYEGSLRPLGATTAPAGRIITADEASSGNYDAELVQMEAYLLDRVVRSGEQVLTLQAGEHVFTAHLEDAPGAEPLRGLRRGSLLRLTGVCSVQVDTRGGTMVPGGYRILLRSPEDVAVLEHPPWLDAEIARNLGLVLALGLAAALGWVSLLRRQVRVHTADLRERLAREAALQDQYRGLFESANDAIYDLDLAGRVTAFNRAAERLTGYDRTELLGTSIERLLAPGEVDRFQAASEDLAAGRDVPVYELELLTKDGRRVTVEASSRLRGEEEGGTAGVETIARDITERRRLEEQLRESQKIEAVGRLAGGVAHDFNNILSVVVGYGEQLRRKLRESSVLQGKAEEILKAARRGAGLVQQLLAFSRRQVLAPKRLDVNLVVREMTDMLDRLIGEDVRLVTRLSPTLGCVKADPTQLQQIIMNLAVNARDAMPRGGELTIETADVDREGPDGPASAGDSRPASVMLAVSDTGRGMDEETIGHVFEPFFTTKERGRGTGLGLATVYGIVKQSGGHISLESDPGRGTRFEILLPRFGQCRPPAPAPATSRGGGGSETILLVEDDEALRDCTRSTLEEYGYRVIEAVDGIEALDVLERLEEPIHLAVTDLVMPRMGGVELGERLAAARPDIRILYVSGYSEDVIRRQGELPAPEPLLRKPFGADELNRRIRGLLEGDSGSRDGLGNGSSPPAAGV